MNRSTKKWLFIKFSSLLLIPLMAWFIINFVSIYDQSHTEVLAFFSNQPAKFLLSLFLITAFFHSALTISEIFEDYIRVEKIKIVANKLLYFLAIIIPLITITVLFKFNL